MDPTLQDLLHRLRSQLDGGPLRVTREDVILLAALAVEREELRAFTPHRPDCRITAPAKWQRRCTCGLEAAEGRSLEWRRRLDALRGLPPPPKADPRRRGKSDRY